MHFVQDTQNYLIICYRKPGFILIFYLLSTTNLYKITFVSSQHQNTNFKGDLVLITGFKRSFERFLVYKENPTHLG